MEGNNMRGGGNVEQIALSTSGGAPPMDSDDWRRQLPLDSRQRIVNKIMETLKKHLPFNGQEGLQQLQKIAVRFEDRIYSAAISQSDYLRKISLKMLTMEVKSQSPMAANSLQHGAAATTASLNPTDQGASASTVAIPISEAPNAGHCEAPIAARSPDLPLSISIGDSQIFSATLSSQPNTHVLHLQAPNPAGSSAKPIAISITISIP